jgi:hypothetical protein
MRSTPFSQPTDCLSERYRIGKHVASHRYSYDGHQDSGTYPLESVPQPIHSVTAPAVLSDSTSLPISISTHRSDHDIETASDSVLTPRRGIFGRRPKPDREHHELTRRAHSKSNVQLFKEILYSSWANLLLVFIPVGIALHFVNINPTIVFVMNFLAIVPLAGVSPFYTCLI